jgi:hypothetical protein
MCAGYDPTRTVDQIRQQWQGVRVVLNEKFFKTPNANEVMLQLACVDAVCAAKVATLAMSTQNVPLLCGLAVGGLVVQRSVRKHLIQLGHCVMLDQILRDLHPPEDIMVNVIEWGAPADVVSCVRSNGAHAAYMAGILAQERGDVFKAFVEAFPDADFSRQLAVIASARTPFFAECGDAIIEHGSVGLLTKYAISSNARLGVITALLGRRFDWKLPSSVLMQCKSRYDGTLQAIVPLLNATNTTPAAKIILVTVRPAACGHLLIPADLETNDAFLTILKIPDERCIVSVIDTPGILPMVREMYRVQLLRVARLSETALSRISEGDIQGPSLFADLVEMTGMFDIADIVLTIAVAMVPSAVPRYKALCLIAARAGDVCWWFTETDRSDPELLRELAIRDRSDAIGTAAVRGCLPL